MASNGLSRNLANHGACGHGFDFVWKWLRVALDANIVVRPERDPQGGVPGAGEEELVGAPGTTLKRGCV
jgi:hypothetical protein